MWLDYWVVFRFFITLASLVVAMRLFRLLKMGVLFLMLEPTMELVYRSLLLLGLQDPTNIIYNVFVTADCVCGFLGLWYLWLSMRQFLKILTKNPKLLEDIDDAATHSN